MNFFLLLFCAVLPIILTAILNDFVDNNYRYNYSFKGMVHNYARKINIALNSKTAIKIYFCAIPLVCLLYLIFAICCTILGWYNHISTTRFVAGIALIAVLFTHQIFTIIGFINDAKIYQYRLDLTNKFNAL